MSNCCLFLFTKHYNLIMFSFSQNQSKQKLNNQTDTNMHIKFEGYNFLNDESCSIQACKTPRKWLIGYLNVNKMHRINLECTPYLLLSPFSLHQQKLIYYMYDNFCHLNPFCNVYLKTAKWQIFSYCQLQKMYHY